MQQFFGGKLSGGFSLSVSFASIADMITAFSRGPLYTLVWYGEYCIISTPDKRHPDNGKVFRRGINYQHLDHNGNPDGDAEYIGNISGPEGNGIEDTVICSDVYHQMYGDNTVADWHLLVRYTNSDIAPSGELEEYNKTLHYWSCTNGDSVTYYRQRVYGSNGIKTPPGIWWRDFGPIKKSSGILIGKNVSPTDVSENPEDIDSHDVIEYLNTEYPNGYLDGKIITYGDDSDEKMFFAFDEQKVSWYYIGVLSSSSTLDCGIYYNDVQADVPQSITNGGVLLIKNDFVDDSTALTDLWDVDYKSFFRELGPASIGGGTGEVVSLTSRTLDISRENDGSTGVNLVWTLI